MSGQWYEEDSSYSTTNLFCGEEPAEALFESTGTSRIPDQIRELLGEDCELEASFLEDSWASGRPISLASCRRKRNQATTNDEDVTFAKWNTLGSFSFSAPNGELSGRPFYAYSTDSANSYNAAWLRHPLEGSASRTDDHASAEDTAGCKNHVYGEGMLGSMTFLRACALLGVSEDSTGTQIRAAYRRMVSEWHPDRMEQSGDKVRAFATKQMTAINEAYHFLREASPARAC